MNTWARRLRDVTAQARRGRPRKEEAAAAEAAFKEIKVCRAWQLRQPAHTWLVLSHHLGCSLA
jgi:hypothetical protein